MDILVVSNIIKNFTEILLISKCKQQNSKFLNDPFNIDLTLLYTNDTQIGGMNTPTEVVETQVDVSQLPTPEGVPPPLPPRNLTPDEIKEIEAVSEIEDIQTDLKDAVASGTDEPGESSLQKLFRVLTKFLIYPILLIFLVIFPYIYTTYASFSKLISGYRENVMTM